MYCVLVCNMYYTNIAAYKLTIVERCIRLDFGEIMKIDELQGKRK